MPVILEYSEDDFESDDDNVPRPSQIQDWANAACQSEEDVVASIKILDNEKMRSLNKEYRGKDKPTNVLSFPMRLPEQVEIELLGDLVFCADMINEEARQQDKVRSDHWAHIVIHGMLHLQGYDHTDESEAEAMEKLEVEILQDLGISNPYELRQRGGD